MLKQMRQGEKWNTIEACGSQQIGRKGLSAGIAMAVRKDVRALLPKCDHAGSIEDSRYISTVLRGESEIVLIHTCGHVGMGHKRCEL